MCLLLKKDFTPFLPQVVPSLFKMATLTLETGVAGANEQASLADVLQEATEKGDGLKLNINTDETEEKDVAIQMLAVFIDELQGGYFDYVEPTEKVLLGLVDFAMNDSIRTSVAGSLPGLVKCIKEAQPDNAPMRIERARLYVQGLVGALKNETETEARVSQIQAIKDCIDEAGQGFFENEALLNEVAKMAMEEVAASDKRIEENNEMVKKDGGEDDDEIDEDDEKLVKEENKGEYELQLSAAELLGILFKTHKPFCGPLVQQLFE